MDQKPVAATGRAGAVPRCPIRFAGSCRGCFSCRLAGNNPGQFQRSGSLARGGRAGKKHGGRKGRTLNIRYKLACRALPQKVFKHGSALSDKRRQKNKHSFDNFLSIAHWNFNQRKHYLGKNTAGKNF